MAGGIEHVRGNLVAVDTGRLRTSSSSVKRIAGYRIALEGCKCVGIYQVSEIVRVQIAREGSRSSHAKRIGGKVSTNHRLCRDQTRKRNSSALPRPLIVHKKEGLVFLNGSAERPAELIQIEFVLRRSEILCGIQLRVAEKLKQGSVELVAALLGRHQYCRTRARAPFGGSIIGDDFEFLDSIDRRQDRDASRCQFIVIIAVEQPVRALGA